ncbi:UDP-3-O-acyl-N-acetylglucosamine deacetylase [Hydrogenimonas urashimensis]|uniref:UDP-3-O-acyl-N-acetylglucosamine deacetylase n=1 Tax=Hydrogenimonas urashimensis TaxID=2740515 RepID=UPI0019164298|nr:UDP-3-O-acyl-N-acetylglucosamine deacetylase [Hydrogenimonas urashimensis]
MKQRTIAKAVKSVGIGLHKGKPVHLVLEPLEADSGIVFYRKDAGVTIPLLPKYVVDTQMATVIGREGVNISTIEHFLSALYAYGIDNMRVVLDDGEMPIMDGSAASFCMMLDEAGIREQNAGKRIIRIKKEVRVEAGEKYVALKPSETADFDFRIRFDHPVIGEQHRDFVFSKSGFIQEIARARTFGFLKEVQYLRSKNLALGGSLENAIVLDDTKVLNPEGLRFEDEFVRHKILDAMGDMKLLGHPILGKYEAFAGSHELNHKLTLALLADASAYEVVTLQVKESVAFAQSFA